MHVHCPNRDSDRMSPAQGLEQSTLASDGADEVAKARVLACAICMYAMVCKSSNNCLVKAEVSGAHVALTIGCKPDVKRIVVGLMEERNPALKTQSLSGFICQA